METIEATLSRPRPRPQQIDFEGFEIGAGDTVVDVGCGPGDVCLYAASRGADVVGIDSDEYPIEQLLKTAKESGYRRIRGILSDGNPIPLPDAFASVVIATEVLEHVDDPTAFLNELVRIGRPGARYMLSVPDPASEGVLRVVAPDWYWNRPLHIRVFERETFETAIKSAGLEVVSRQSSGFYWSIWWACRLAIGMDQMYDEAPSHPIFDHWNGLMDELLATPRGRQVLKALDALIPKSQVVIARKPEAVAEAVTRPISRRIRQFLRDGSIKLGGFDVQWTVRRSA